MTRPNEEADRLWIRASQLRLIADELEKEAALLRPSRTPMDHHRYFQWIAERDGTGCSYCGYQLHPFDAAHTTADLSEVVFPQYLGLVKHPFCREVPHHLQRCAHVDHVIPVAKGGTNDLANLVLACIHCNLSKGATSAEEFRLRLALEQLELLAEYYAGGGDATLVQGLLVLVHDALPERLWPSWVKGAMDEGR